MYQGKNLVVNKSADNIAELIFDVQDESVNIFNMQTDRDFAEALTVLESDETVKGLLIRSAKDSFIAGADITEFGPVFAQGAETIRHFVTRTSQSFSRLEDLPFPTVVAIKGFALGGGCEISLACDYRIAATGSLIGLPETKLGIIPGWGGTVRLPRVAGIETAIEWIATAKNQKAAAALKAGVIDGLVDEKDLIQAGLNVLQQCIDGKLDYLSRREQKKSPLKHNRTELTMAFTTSKAMVAAQAGKNYPAPMAVIDAIEKSAGLHRDAALEIEKQTFIAMALTPIATALSGIFLNDQFISSKAKTLAKQADKSVDKAAVIGAGIMGGGIAYQSALKNIPIKMKDINQQGIDLGLSEANKLLTKRVERKRLSISEMGEVLNRIEPTLSYDGFDHVQLVVEAVVENPKIKQAVLAEVEQQVSADTIITSNTSTISIDLLAKELKRPENFCGMHFFNPVHAMPLVEVIRGSKTSDQAIARTVAYANAMGKKAIVVNDCPGFLVNRVLFPYFKGFAMLLRDGADFQQVDKVMEAWGWPMGPAYLLDVVGIDTGVHAQSVMAKGFPSRMKQDFTSAMDALYEAKRFGQKNDQGFYDYVLDKKGKTQKVSSDESVKLIKPHVGASKTFSDEEIISRMMIPMATELARCLEEEVVASPAEADMALVYGLGFPPFRGGIFRWLDSVGIKEFCTMAKSYEALGELYQVTDGMRVLEQQEGAYYAV